MMAIDAAQATRVSLFKCAIDSGCAPILCTSLRTVWVACNGSHFGWRLSEFGYNHHISNDDKSGRYYYHPDESHQGNSGLFRRAFFSKPTADERSIHFVHAHVQNRADFQRESGNPRQNEHCPDGNSRKYWNVCKPSAAVLLTSDQWLAWDMCKPMRLPKQMVCTQTRKPCKIVRRGSNLKAGYKRRLVGRILAGQGDQSLSECLGLLGSLKEMCVHSSASVGFLKTVLLQEYYQLERRLQL